MIEQSTVEAAVQECSQAADETMYGDIIVLFEVYGSWYSFPYFFLGNKCQAFSAALHAQELLCAFVFLLLSLKVGNVPS